MRILGIETSCDETAIAIAEFPGSGSKPRIKILSNIVSSQVELHAKYGGVVPNLAKREHQRNLVPILLRALRESRIMNHESRGRIKTLNSKFLILNSILEREPELLKRFKKSVLPLKPPKIDAIAVTFGPGLAPALWVGVNFAKALAYLWGKPLIPVNHMAGHLYSALINVVTNKRPLVSCNIRKIQFPALALLVSGGHTELVIMQGHGKFKILGETLDDAAGEAFDKVARILGLGYPGGPALSALAERKLPITNEELQIRLPRPMINSKDYNFSFSGLKTAVLYLARDLGVKKTRQLRPLIAKEFQDAAVEVLVKKTLRAAKEYKVNTVLLGGGVAANRLLRKELRDAVQKELPHVACHLSFVALAGDNAIMIALAAYFSGKKKAPAEVGADANSRLGA